LMPSECSRQTICTKNMPLRPSRRGNTSTWKNPWRSAFRGAIGTPAFNGVGRAWYSLGKAFQSKGELDNAIAAYHQALGENGYEHTGYAWHAIGYALQMKGELDQAIDAYQKSIDTPGYDHIGRAWYDVGNAVQAKGELDQAIEIYRKALEMPGSDYKMCAWLKLGMAYKGKGDMDQAIKAWKKASVARKSDDPPSTSGSVDEFEIPRNFFGTESGTNGICAPSFSTATARSSGPIPDETLNSFPPRAQRVLALAREEAIRMDHYFAGTEHVLLGLISLSQGVAVNVLLKLGINLTTLRETIEKGVGTGPDQRLTRNPAFTPRAKRALALAVKEAKIMNHAYIGTEHILLGLLNEGSGVAARVLKDLGVDFQKTRAEILKELDINSDADGNKS